MAAASKLKINRNHLWALAVFAAALLIRLPGMGWGLPNENQAFSLHPDEPVVQIYSQQVNPAQGDFTPGFYNYGTLGLTVNSVAMRMADAYGPNPETDPAGHSAAQLLAGRMVSALAGAGLVLGLWLFLRRRIGDWGAGSGALAAAFAPGLLTHSRFMTVDVLATAIALAALVWAVKAAEAEPGKAVMRASVVAGLMTGLAAGVKYNMALALLALWAALALARPKGWLAAAAAGAGASIVAFLFSTPGAVLETAAFVRDVQYELLHTSSGHGLVFAGTSPGFIYHFFNLAAAYGLGLVVLSIVGLAHGGRKKQAWILAWCVFAVAYYVLIGRAEVKFMRYVFPLIPVLAAGFGWLAAAAVARKDRMGRVGVAAGILALGGFPLGGLSGSMVQTTWMMSADPRQEAADWLRQAGEGKSVGVPVDPWFSTPTLYPLSAAPRMMPFEARDEAMRAVENPRVLRFVPENPDERFDWDTRLLDEQPDFVTFSSFESDDVERLAGAQGLPGELQVQVDRYAAFAKRLSEEYEPAIAGFGLDGPPIHDLMYIRPRVWIWKRRADSSATSTGTSTGSGTSEAPATAP